MIVRLDEKHLEILRACNDNLLRYLVRNDYSWADPNENQSKLYDTLDLWVDAPVSPEEYKLYIKVLGQGRRDIVHFWGFFKPQVMALPSAEFTSAYQDRIIANHNGLKINFMRHDSVLGLENPHTHQLEINTDNLFTLHALYFFGVEYLLIDEYPVSNPICNYTSNRSMVVWVNPTEENAKKFRKASDYFSGNPPSVKEMCRDRRYMQGNTYFQTYYKSLDFNEIYQKRKIINCKGVEAHFAKL